MPEVRLSDLVRRAEKQLAAADVDNPHLDARILIAHALGLDRAQLLSQSDRVLNDDETQRIETLIARRTAREPVARIVGQREFWGLPFGLNEATLVPRPESETLIEAALEAINRRHPGASRNPGGLSVGANGIAPLRILDLGTGSGCLLLALLHELPNATGLGVDASHRAVEQAKINAETLGLAARAEFRVNDWADGVEDKFDLVISNPPYVAQGDIVGLMPEVRDFDPALALDGGVDGLNVYRFLIPQLPGLLKPGSAAIFEIGAGQAKAVSNLFRATGFTNIETRKDLSGVERCIIAQK